MVLFNQISIIGVGLIGGSLAKSIRKKAISRRIVGFFRDEKKLKRAVSNRIVDSGYRDLARSIQGSSLVIIALPVNQIIRFLPKIKRLVAGETLIVDVGSTKSKITQLAARLKLRFVGSHPLAGSEKKGASFSTDRLFSSSKVILTPTPKTNRRAVKKVVSFWRRLGARVIVLTPSQHDKVLSFTSHLPHLTSFCLMNCIPNECLKFSASGLKDTTRIALSDARVWSDILLDNKRELLRALDAFERKMGEFKRSIRKGNRGQLVRMINLSKSKRDIIR